MPHAPPRPAGSHLRDHTRARAHPHAPGHGRARALVTAPGSGDQSGPRALATAQGAGRSHNELLEPSATILRIGVGGAEPYKRPAPSPRRRQRSRPAAAAAAPEKGQAGPPLPSPPPFDAKRRRRWRRRQRPECGKSLGARREHIHARARLGALTDAWG